VGGSLLKSRPQDGKIRLHFCAIDSPRTSYFHLVLAKNAEKALHPAILAVFLIACQFCYEEHCEKQMDLIRKQALARRAGTTEQGNTMLYGKSRLRKELR